jgi:hypothetical protein
MKSLIWGGEYNNNNKSFISTTGYIYIYDSYIDKIQIFNIVGEALAGLITWLGKGNDYI